MTPLIQSIRCGPVAELAAGTTGEWWDKPWTSGFHKHAVGDEVGLGPLGLDGDAQADRVHHERPFPQWTIAAANEVMHRNFNELFRAAE